MSGTTTRVLAATAIAAAAVAAAGAAVSHTNIGAEGGVINSDGTHVVADGGVINAITADRSAGVARG